MIKKINQVLVVLILATFLGISAIHAEDAMVYPTLPGTSIRDYSRPGVKIEGDKAYPTLPGISIRDYSKPGYKIDLE